MAMSHYQRVINSKLILFPSARRVHAQPSRRSFSILSVFVDLSAEPRTEANRIESIQGQELVLSCGEMPWFPINNLSHTKPWIPYEIPGIWMKEQFTGLINGKKRDFRQWFSLKQCIQRIKRGRQVMGVANYQEDVKHQ